MGPKLIQVTTEKVKLIQKSYAYKDRRDVILKEGDFMFLKISPWKGIMRPGEMRETESELY